MSVIIDQLRISGNGKKMNIDAHVNKAEHFKDRYIDNICIVTADHVSETNPDVPTSNHIYYKKFEEDIKDLHLVLDASDFVKSWEDDPKTMAFHSADMSTSLFFVYITCRGTPGPCTPCTLDENTVLGIVFDENKLHQRVMDFTKDLVNDCSIHTDFIDFILQWNAFKASVQSGHYISAIKFYNMLFGNLRDNGYTNVIKGCGCHG